MHPSSSKFGLKIPNSLRSRSFSKAQLAVFVAVFAIIGGYILITSRAAGTTANLWVDTTGGSCTRSATLTIYNDAAACASIQAAIAASQPGDQIIIKAGSYGAQNITSSSTSPGVTISGEQSNGSNAVILSGLNPLGNWLTIKDVNVSSGLDIANTPVGTPNNITFNNIDWTGNWFLSNCCSNIQQIGGRIHNYSAGSDPSAIMFQSTASGTPMSNITLNGVEIDHMTHTVSGSHFEAVRTQGWVSNLTVKNSYFHDNGVNSSQIFISSFTGGTAQTPGPIVIEGNYFDVPVSGAGDSPAFYNINGNMQGLACPNLTVRYNTNKSSLISPIGDSNGISCAAGTFTNVKVSSNISPRSAGSCTYYTYDHNLWINSSSANCGTGDQTVASTTAAGLTGDGFHITSSSPAIDKGDPGYCPANDRDGDTRPQGNACDVGADEYVAPSNVANLWIDTTGGTCTRNSTPAVYNDTAACGSFSAAWNAAQCGDSINVQPGSYGAQTISTTKSCTSSTQITFYSQGSITLTGGLDINTSYAVFNGSGFNFAQTYTVEQAANYVGLVGVSAPHAFIMGTNVTIKGGQIGPNNNCTTGWEDGLQIWDNGSVSASFVTVDGVTFHDISDNGNECAGFPNSGVHTDCIQMLGPNNVTIKNSTFYNCATSDVIGRPYTTPMHDITIQNNMMGPVVTPGASINIGNSSDVCNNVTIQYNTISGTYPSMVCGAAGSSGNIVRGNIFPGYFSQAGFTNSYNISEATIAIGTGSKQCTPVFNPASSGVANYHLDSADTCAKSAGDPANFPVIDFDGDTRTTPPDAGADELVGGGSSDTTAPSVPTNTTLSGSTTTTLTLSWTASTDNVGVAGYRMYKNGTAVTTTTNTTYTFTGLTCNTSYTLGLTAFDAAGNESSLASDQGSFSTAACGGIQGDLNGDSHVTVTDLSILLSHYGQTATATQGDINNDGTCNILDLSILLSNYGT